MTNEQVMKLYNGLRQASSVAFPIKVSYAMTRNCRTLLPIVEAYDSSRTALIQKYGAPSIDNPNQYNIPEENQLEFLAEFENLDHLEAGDINLMYVTLDDLGDAKLSPEQMDGIFAMIEGEE